MLDRENIPLGHVQVVVDEVGLFRTYVLHDAWIATLRGVPVWLYGQVPIASNAGDPAGRRRHVPWSRVVYFETGDERTPAPESAGVDTPITGVFGRM